MSNISLAAVAKQHMKSKNSFQNLKNLKTTENQEDVKKRKGMENSVESIQGV